MLLLDTHVVVWLALEPARLSQRARAAIGESRRSGDGVAISDITLFEIATLASRGRIQLGISVENFLEEIEKRMTVLAMTAQVCARAVTLGANYPKDPADKIIGATAIVHGATLVTADAMIRHSKALRAIW